VVASHTQNGADLVPQLVQVEQSGLLLLEQKNPSQSHPPSCNVTSIVLSIGGTASKDVLTVSKILDEAITPAVNS
jgi:hypothetical protein